jgi:hypothetical protein
VSEGGWERETEREGVCMCMRARARQQHTRSRVAVMKCAREVGCEECEGGGVCCAVLFSWHACVLANCVHERSHA